MAPGSRDGMDAKVTPYPPDSPEVLRARRGRCVRCGGRSESMRVFHVRGTRRLAAICVSHGPRRQVGDVGA